MLVHTQKVITIHSLSFKLIGFSWPRVSGSTSGTFPRLIPPHSVKKPYTNWLRLCIVPIYDAHLWIMLWKHSKLQPDFPRTHYVNISWPSLSLWMWYPLKNGALSRRLFPHPSLHPPWKGSRIFMRWIKGFKIFFLNSQSRICAEHRVMRSWRLGVSIFDRSMWRACPISGFCNVGQKTTMAWYGIGAGFPLYGVPRKERTTSFIIPWA